MHVPKKLMSAVCFQKRGRTEGVGSACTQLKLDVGSEHTCAVRSSRPGAKQSRSEDWVCIVNPVLAYT